MTELRAVIERAADAFGEAELCFGHGTDSAWDEAVALALHVTGLGDDRANLNATVSAAEAREVERIVASRIEHRVPLPYLLGKARFAGADFLVEPGVVVPRSPLAQLIESRFSPWLRGEPGRVLDLCTGTGCIGIACALAFTDADVVLADVDPAAVALAARNVFAHGVGERVAVVWSDVYEAIDGRFDLIVANPPYVDATDMAALPAEYRAEPRRGLAGGADGLDVARRIIDGCGAHLTPSGLLVCEVGNSGAALHAAYPAVPFIWPDLPLGGEGVFLLEAERAPSHTLPPS